MTFNYLTTGILPLKVKYTPDKAFVGLTTLYTENIRAIFHIGVYTTLDLFYHEGLEKIRMPPVLWSC